jgi:hypothetical protein
MLWWVADGLQFCEFPHAQPGGDDGHIVPGAAAQAESLMNGGPDAVAQCIVQHPLGT